MNDFFVFDDTIQFLNFREVSTSCTEKTVAPGKPVTNEINLKTLIALVDKDGIFTKYKEERNTWDETMEFYFAFKNSKEENDICDMRPKVVIKLQFGNSNHRNLGAGKHKGCNDKQNKMINEAVELFRKNCKNCVAMQNDPSFREHANTWLGPNASTKHIAEVLTNICGIVDKSGHHCLSLCPVSAFVAKNPIVHKFGLQAYTVQWCGNYDSWMNAWGGMAGFVMTMAHEFHHLSETASTDVPPNPYDAEACKKNAMDSSWKAWNNAQNWKFFFMDLKCLAPELRKDRSTEEEKTVNKAKEQVALSI